MDPDERLRLSQFQAILATPLGPLGVRVVDQGVTEIRFLPEDTPLRDPEVPLAEVVARQLAAYFGDPKQPFDLPLASRGTPFQERVWRALEAIPPGQTRTYGELARQLGTGPRAVGGACRANPCPILVPCHRVVAARGAGGYAGARTGPWPAIKHWLLTHEGSGPEAY